MTNDDDGGLNDIEEIIIAYRLEAGYNNAFSHLLNGQGYIYLEPTSPRSYGLILLHPPQGAK